MLFDTGGANMIFPEVARELGLEVQGALQGRGVGEKSEDTGLAKIKALTVGKVTLSAPLFMVIPMQDFENVEGTREQGLVGYEIFKRFVVEIAYSKGRLTLTLTRRSRNQEGCLGLRPPDPGLRIKPRFAGHESGLARGPESEAQVFATLHKISRRRDYPRPSSTPNGAVELATTDHFVDRHAIACGVVVAVVAPFADPALSKAIIPAVPHETVFVELAGSDGHVVFPIAIRWRDREIRRAGLRPFGRWSS